MTDDRSSLTRRKLWSAALQVLAIILGVWLGILTFGWITN